jgi:hypothetical protein
VAYQSQQYKTFLEQLPLFTSGTNYAYFGWRKKFESMIQNARSAKQ